MKANVFLNNIQNKWHNVYWFSRMLISNDKYVAIGKEPKLLSLLASSLKVISNEKLTTDILKLQKQTLKNIIQKRYKKTSTRKIRVERLLTDLDEMIKTAEDVEVFIMTCENILLPLQQAISNIPNDDKEFTLNIAKSYLEIQGEKGLATVINL